MSPPSSPIQKFGFLLLATCLLIGTGSLIFNSRLVRAQRANSPVKSTTAQSFTYQGYLKDNGQPANGSYEFEFRLFDAHEGGQQIGSVQAEALPVLDGVFTAQLNDTGQFGINLFDGSARFLEIKALDAVQNQYFTVGTRQELTAVSHALHAQKTEPIANLITVAKSGGDHTTITDALNSITDANASNPYLIRIAPGIYEEVVTLKSYVSLVGSGEDTTMIRHTGSNTAPDTNGDSATMRANGVTQVEVRLLTVESISPNHATAIWTKNISPQSLSFTYVTARAVSASQNSHGIIINNAAPTLKHVTAIAEGNGPLGIGIYNQQSAAPTIAHTTATATGQNQSYGIYNSSNAAPQISDTLAKASEGNYAFGIYNHAASVTLRKVETTAENAHYENTGLTIAASTATLTNVTSTATGGEKATGIANSDSTITLTNIRTTGSAGSDMTYGLLLLDTTATLTKINAYASGSGNNYAIYASAANSEPIISMNNIIAEATNGTASYGFYSTESVSLNSATISAANATLNYALYAQQNDGNPQISIDQATLSGGSAIRNGNNFQVYVGSSRLIGSVSDYKLTCINTYDFSYDLLNTRCKCITRNQGCIASNPTNE